MEGREGYAALRRMLNGQTLASCTRRANAIVDDRFENQRLPRFNRKSTMWEDLYEQYGYFCYIAHNHIIEYLPQRLSAIADNPKEAGIDHWWTREFLDSKIAAENARAREYLAGEREFAERSGEIAVNVVEAAVTGKPVMEVVNMVNVGQVDNLPRGFALETNGLIHSSGFTPLALGAIPDVLKGLLEPHIVSQAMLVDACLERDERKAIQALLINPMCASIHPDRVLAMAREGMEAVKRYMPEDS
ncbi:MAG: Alpha-galactosidase [candidate division BRC1 bacterium ADurb.BinA364]|nr:MAG: Alpha-galactosidase [candidate division BRC1 bacterium ADurb.BinA364]